MTDENPVQTEKQQAEVVGEASKAPKPRARKKAAPAKPVKTATKSEAPAPASKAKRYSSAERSTILASVAKSVGGGKTTLQAALKNEGISEQTYYRWKRDADKGAPAAPTPRGDELKDLLALEAENQRLRKELADRLRAENAELRRRLAKA
ncbi:MAG: transposase [Rhizobiales bacterium]|nr:transposase [Hyphomicrobiales bacterium]OJY04821.1 MAG: hypothetical protein BGP07_08925 [Rhizobiales bacterium 63-22]